MPIFCVNIGTLPNTDINMRQSHNIGVTFCQRFDNIRKKYFSYVMAVKNKTAILAIFAAFK